MSRHRRWAARALAVVATAALCASPAAGASTVPSTAASRTPTAASSVAEPTGPAAHATALVKEMSVDEQASAVVMGHVSGTDPSALRAYMQSGLGGFILMGANIPDSESQLQALTAAMTIDPALPPLIAVDQEGGIVSRLHGDDYAASTTLKRLPVDATSAAFTARGSLVARAGITVNFGTVADFTADSGTFIYGRALGTDPASAADRVSAATTAQEQFVASTLKHFPGHGAAPGDSHSAIPSTSMGLDEWRSTEASRSRLASMPEHLSSCTGISPTRQWTPCPPPSRRSGTRSPGRNSASRGVAVTDDLGMLLSSGNPAYADSRRQRCRRDRRRQRPGADDRGLRCADRGQDGGRDRRRRSKPALCRRSGSQEAATRVLTLRTQLSAASARWTLCADCEPAG